MTTRTFSAEFLLSVLYEDKAEIVMNRIRGHSRWSIHYSFVFRYESKLYRTSYSVGATETQDKSPWQYDDVVITTEVEEAQEVVTVYVPVK